ncbi:MAG: conditioned medium-induced protein 4 [Salinirussus sp.]
MDDSDEMTDHLRDVFREVTGADAATERQADQRGSLLGDNDADRLRAVVAEMRETVGFETDLDDDALVTVVELFHGGADDAAIADALGIDEATVFRARTDLHLLRDDDAEPRLVAAVRTGSDGPSVDEATPPGVDPAVVERARQVATAQAGARRHSDRFRLAFEDALVEAGLDEQLAADARADGLREAAEDIETELDL